ncbi:acyltransferase [Vibrio sp. SCSIO 43136]|nr:acyltransferase [Vibrio sp. SCSIO 43136]
MVIFHINKDWLPGGFVGVDMFFVISGFLISSIILNKKTLNTFYFIDFYQSRIRRILPAYLFLMIVTLLTMTILLTPRDFNFFHDSFLKSLFFYSNNYFSDFGNYFAPNSNELPLLHTWSLSIEMQFYLVLPFFILFLSKKKFISISIGIILLSLLYTHYQIIFNNNSQSMYFSLLARSGEFLVGSLIACCNLKPKNNFHSNVISITGLILVVLSIVYLTKDDIFPGFSALPVCIGTALIITSSNSVVNKALSHPVLVFLGTISYSLYLWHWPVLSTLRYYSNSYALDYSELIIFTFLTISFSALSYYLIENKFRNKNSSKKILFQRYTFLLTVVLTLTYSTKYINNNIITELQTKYTRYAPADKICHGTIIGDCFRGDRSSNSEALVLGDSHAAQLNLFFDVVGESRSVRFKVITASNCVTIPNFDYTKLPKYSQGKCAEQIAYTKELVKNAKTIIIAGHWAYQITHENFTKRLNAFLDSTKERGQTVIILPQVPLFKSNIMRINRFEQLGLPLKIERNEDWIKANNTIKEISGRYNNVKYVELSELRLFQEVPYYEGELIYFDNSHLNEVGAVKYGELAIDAIDL